jgi:hypothetical protein
VKDHTKQHELAVMDTKVALMNALKKMPERSVSEFWTWPALYRFVVQDTRPAGRRHPSGQRTINPDAFLRLSNAETGGDTYFYFEVDLNNEVQRTLQDKMLAYLEHDRERGVLDFLGFNKEDPNVLYRGFRVLFVVGKPTDPRQNKAERSADAAYEERSRVNNFAHWCLSMKPPIKTLAWIATRQDFLRDPLGPIWIRPKDYLEATAGTPYDPIRTDWMPIQREVARDRLVDPKINRVPLFPAKKNAPNDVGA